MSPPLGEHLLDSLGEPFEPGWSEETEQDEQVETLVGNESEMETAMGGAGTLPSADDLARSVMSMSDVKVGPSSRAMLMHRIWDGCNVWREQHCWNLNRIPPPSRFRHR